MDRKSIAILVACIALLVCMNLLVNRKFPPIPVPASTNQVSNAANPAPVGANAGAAQSAGGNQAAASLTNIVSTLVVHPEIPEVLQVVSNDNARYTFTSRGGGLKKVELLHYQMASLNAASRPPMLAILGDESVQGDGIFKLTPINGGIRAEKVLSNGLTVVKDFQLSSNYLVNALVRLENRSKQQLALPAQEWVVGTTTPMGPQDTGQAESVSWYNGTNTLPVSLTYFSTNTTSFLILSRTPKTEYRAGNNDLVWASAQNQYFALATMPVMNPPPAEGETTNTNAPLAAIVSNTSRLPAAIVVRMVDLPPPTQDEISANSRTVRNPTGLQASLVYPGATLAPGEAVENHFNLFAGPKEYNLLLAIGAQLNNNFDLTTGFNGFIGTIARGLLGAMNWMHARMSVNYGLAIIIITVVIKLVFWPLTQYSTKSMKRMSALQPQIKALQEKYKDDPAKLSQKQMELWKKNKVNPASGCLPALVQFPVFFGLLRMLQNAIELRGAQFLWMGDLSKPDTLFMIPGFNFPFNLMPLLMGATMLWQSHTMPASPGVDPTQQKMMRYMPLLILVFVYFSPSGLALYYTVQNLLSILQLRLTNAQTAAAAAPAPVPVAPQKKRK